MLLKTVQCFSCQLWIKQITLCSYSRVGEIVVLFGIGAFKSILQFAKLACYRFGRKFEVQILNKYKSEVTQKRCYNINISRTYLSNAANLNSPLIGVQCGRYVEND